MFPSKGRDGTSANTDQYGKTFNCKKLSDTSAHLTHAVSIRGDEQLLTKMSPETSQRTTRKPIFWYFIFRMLSNYICAHLHCIEQKSGRGALNTVFYPAVPPLNPSNHCSVFSCLFHAWTRKKWIFLNSIKQQIISSISFIQPLSLAEVEKKKKTPLLQCRSCQRLQHRD